MTGIIKMRGKPIHVVLDWTNSFTWRVETMSNDRGTWTIRSRLYHEGSRRRSNFGGHKPRTVVRGLFGVAKAMAGQRYSLNSPSLLDFWI